MSPSLEFDVVDVFARTPFEGNPLAVVLGAEGLDTGQMQRLAREFNLSETAFPLAPADAERARGVDYRLRIFTPLTELPFAGHPSVGAAWLLAQRGVVRPGRVVQACGAGDLPLEVSPDGGPVTLTGGTPHTRPAADVEELVAAVGLTRDDVVGTPGVAGTGVDFTHVPVTAKALSRAEPDLRVLHAVGSVHLFVWTTPGGPDPVRTRMFAPDLGVPEDPATGSAALGLAVHAVATGLLPADGTSRFTARQGVEMGRPSTLHLEVDAARGVATSARVSGDVVRVSAGRIAVPS